MMYTQKKRIWSEINRLTSEKYRNKNFTTKNTEILHVMKLIMYRI